MKHLLVVIFLALFTIIGCGDDNIVNNSTILTNETLLFQLDSLGIETSNSGWIYQMKTYTNILIYSSNIKVEFTGYTNLDTTCQMSLYVSASKSGHNYFSYFTDNPASINQFHSFNIASTGRENYLNFIAQIIYLNPEIIEFNGNGYIYFKNIKVYTN